MALRRAGRDHRVAAHLHIVPIHVETVEVMVTPASNAQNIACAGSAPGERMSCIAEMLTPSTALCIGGESADGLAASERVGQVRPAPRVVGFEGQGWRWFPTGKAMSNTYTEVRVHFCVRREFAAAVVLRMTMRSMLSSLMR